MKEAYAQTAEVIEATSGAVEWYSGAAGIVAGTWLIVSIGLVVAIIFGYRLLVSRNNDLAELRVKCAEEIAQAKIDAMADANKQVEACWERVNQIHASTINLFEKADRSNEKVEQAVNKLTTILATQGVFSRE